MPRLRLAGLGGENGSSPVQLSLHCRPPQPPTHSFPHIHTHLCILVTHHHSPEASSLNFRTKNKSILENVDICRRLRSSLSCRLDFIPLPV